jgi:hypothetical protein
LIKVYTEGTHLDDKRFVEILEYRRGKKIEIEAPEGFIYSFDGELIRQNKFTVEVVPNAIRFAVSELMPRPFDKHQIERRRKNMKNFYNIEEATDLLMKLITEN